jgi:hypothetical protein
MQKWLGASFTPSQSGRRLSRGPSAAGPGELELGAPPMTAPLERDEIAAISAARK